MSSAAAAIRPRIERDHAQKEARVQLVARVQVAYEHLCDATRLRGSSRGAAIEAARTRLAALNLALAVVAVQGG